MISLIIRIAMIPSKIFLILGLILLAGCQSGFNKNFAEAVKSIRQSLSQVSLVGNWKFLQDSNFVINKKITMINEGASQIMRNNDKLSFISSDASIREAEAYFDSDREGSVPKTLYIELYDGLYYTNNTVALEIDLKQLQASHRSDGNTNLWNNTKPIIVVCMLIQNKQILAQISTSAVIEIYTNAKESDLKNENNRFYVKFQSNTFSFYAELKYVTDQYNRFADVQGVCTFLFFILLAFFKPKKSLYNISEWMILQAFGFTIVVSWLFIRVSLEKIDTSLKFVGLCAFINICLAFFFLRNYEEVLKSFKLTYERLASISALLGYFILCYFLEESLTFWIFQSFCLMALQINYSYSTGGRGGLSVVLVFTLLFMRIPYFYYRFASPQLTREPSDYKSLGIFIITNAALLVFIIMQHYFGSRFMIPKELIPDYFNYFQRLPIGDEVLEEVCPICTLKLKQQAGLDEGLEQNDEDLEQSAQPPQPQLPTQAAAITQIKIMVTPCNHKYHSKCLLVWMENRLICPYCRSALPPSETQRDDSYCC